MTPYRRRQEVSAPAAVRMVAIRLGGVPRGRRSCSPALYMFVPPFKGSGPVFNLLGLAPVVAIVVGIRLHRPSSRAPWLLFAAGSALFWLGDLYTYSYPLLLGAEVPFPSPGDGLYLLVYPVIMAGLILLVRRRSAGADRGGLIDGLILTVGLALPSWVALMAPYIHIDDLSFSAKLVSVAYPLGDVILLGAAVRLALDAGRREPAFYLLSSSIVMLLATDFAYGLLTLHGLYDHQLWLDLGWIGFYLLWGAGALHPSMARLDQSGQEREVILTRFRLGLLTCASLIAPVIGHHPRAPCRRHRLPRGAGRVGHPVRAGHPAHGGARAPAGAIARARADPEPRRRRAGRRVQPRGDRSVAVTAAALARRARHHRGALPDRRRGLDHARRAGRAAGAATRAQAAFRTDRLGQRRERRDDPPDGRRGRGPRPAGRQRSRVRDRRSSPRRAEPVSLVLAGGDVSSAVRAAARALATQVAPWRSTAPC